MTVYQELIDYYRSSPLSFIKIVPASDILFDERAHLMCKYGCKNYNRKHSCPPQSIKIQKKISKYRWCLLFATSTRVNNVKTWYGIKNINRVKECEIQRISHEIGTVFHNNKIDSIVLSGGACKRCKMCSKQFEKGCKKPSLKQTSMEAIGIDCQKTMHNAGYDFAMPNVGSINRCGCVFFNDKIPHISKNKHRSYQMLKKPTKNNVLRILDQLLKDNGGLFSSIKIIPIKQIKIGQKGCNKQCCHYNRNYSCPPYSEKINLNLWKYGIVWEWKINNLKKYSYNTALKMIHTEMYRLGYYFSLSLRNGPCNGCLSCNYPNDICAQRKLLSPSLQSQGIDPTQFGEGDYGIELI